MLIIRFIHYLGVAMWIGGWLAGIVWTRKTTGYASAVRACMATHLASVQTLIVGPGAVLTVGSGVMWSMAAMGADTYQSRVAPVGLWIMTAAGILGGIVVLVGLLPAANRLRAVSVVGSDGQMLPSFDEQMKRLTGASYFAGACALVSLLAAVIAP